MHNALMRLCTGALLVAALAYLIYLPAWVTTLLIAAILLLILTTEWPRLAHGWLWLLTPIYPVLPFVLAILLNQSNEYRFLLILLVICVATHDTGAYVAGKLFGKNKLCPAISPGKTWQGFIGGCVSVAALLFFGTLYTASDASATTILIVAATIAVVATAGDLFESWLKRRAGLKDSGCLLPGHGGLLDRFDGMMSCMYLLYFYKDVVARWF
jgi:phosphatidate cytidylyltransferase